MYRKSVGILLTVPGLVLIGYFFVFLSNAKQPEQVKSIYEIRLNQIVLANEQSSGLEISKNTSAEQRVVTYCLLEKKIEEPLPKAHVRASITREDYENLLRIVEAEASGEDETGKLLVANVVLNRVESEAFPDTITEVIFEKNNGVTQFSPVANGRFWEVEISDETVAAVDRALAGEDVSRGALYFAARKYADQSNMRWFDESLDYLFTHGGHEFFTQ